MNATVELTPEIREAYSRYTRADSIRNAKVACMLVIILMPMGYVLDYFVYPESVGHFFKLRLMCSALAALVLAGLRLPGLSDRQYRVLCAGWYVVPSFFICWMIGMKEGATSPYYAGLNLVILAVSSVIQATLAESIVAVAIIVFMYLAACFLQPTVQNWRLFVNNAYFTFCTIAIVVTGNYFYNRLRFREFSLRYELDENRRLLEESNRKLVELDGVKNRFFANISHELRTPLTLLLSPLETMLQQFNSAPDEATRGTLLIMQSNGMRLLKLINDLLDLVRLESGRMEVKREPLEFSAFIQGMARAAQQVADNKKVTFTTVVQPEVGAVMADRDKLEKTILNLVFNALKFTPAGGRVELRAEKSGDDLVLTVADTGVGISQKNLPFVFDRFWQADDSSKRKYQGVGIGLSLVKELTEIQGGKVSVTSQEGKGTTFTVRIPHLPAEAGAVPQVEDKSATTGTGVQSEEWLANLYRRAELFPSVTPSQDTPAVADTAATNGGQPLVLMADDEPDMLRFLKSQLVSRYRFAEASDGRQAVERAMELLPDIILLDMNMPEKDGLQVCRELRQVEATQKIPIILLTARADEVTKLAALAAGANDFLSKPFSTSELHVRIRNLVDSHHYQEKLAQQKQLLEKTIDQLKDTESQLVQTEKLASLGRLSAGIIHEINNPLNFATTGLFTLRNKGRLLAPEQQADYAEVLKDVEEGLARVRDIVLDLRTFTHAGGEQLTEVEVSGAVTSALRFLSNEWRDTVRIEQDLPAPQLIRADKNRLTQVFVNLLQNSLDALKRKNFNGEQPTIWIEGRVENGKRLLIVRDNGEGIAETNLDKIFDPFFTTKDVGEGMGLGLSISYRIVQEFGGVIRVRSERGKFCEITLEFPAVG